jgi:YggT family protein
MRVIFGLLATIAGIYWFLLLARLILSWFTGLTAGKLVDLLTRVTDPYLDLWRRNLNLRLGFIDLSPIAAIACLSLVQSVLLRLSQSETEKITIGTILSLVLLAVWSVISFFLGFCVVILILRMIAYLTNRDIYSPFWRVIDSITQPMLYRINRIIYGKRIVGYLKGIITSAIALAAIWIGGKIAVHYLDGLLSKI